MAGEFHVTFFIVIAQLAEYDLQPRNERTAVTINIKGCRRVCIQNTADTDRRGSSIPSLPPGGLLDKSDGLEHPGKGNTSIADSTLHDSILCAGIAASMTAPPRHSSPW